MAKRSEDQARAIGALEAAPDVFVDKFVCKADGTLEAKKSYFYGETDGASRWAAKVQGALAAAGVAYGRVDSRNECAKWPKMNYYVAVVRF